MGADIRPLFDKVNQEEQAVYAQLNADIAEITTDFEVIDSRIGEAQTNPTLIVTHGTKTLQPVNLSVEVPQKIILAGAITTLSIILEILELGVPVVRKIMKLLRFVTGDKFETKVENILQAIEFVVGWVKSKISIVA